VIGDIHVGDQASFWFGSVVRGDMFYIRIGDHTNVQDNCVLHTRTRATFPGTLWTTSPRGSKSSGEREYNTFSPLR
jgi:carbonic anhydrase/acetyltransferase-like protein (isoleucine patch superfamily)